MAIEANDVVSAIQAVVRKAVVGLKDKRLDSDVVPPRRRRRGETFISRHMLDAADRTDFANQMKAAKATRESRNCRERLKEIDRGEISERLCPGRLGYQECLLTLD